MKRPNYFSMRQKICTDNNGLSRVPAFGPVFSINNAFARRKRGHYHRADRAFFGIRPHTLLQGAETH
jgi:hypothetical protein